MPSLIRFLCILGVLAAACYAGMLALVRFVEPTPREFVVTIPQDRLAKRSANVQARRTTEADGKELQAVEPNRLGDVLESLKISR